MKITATTELDVPVLRIEGDIEVDNAPQLEQAAREAFGSTGVRIVLDLEKCTHLSSSALAVLFSLVRWARSKQGKVMAVRPSAQLLHLLRTVQLTGERGFAIFIDMKSARDEIRALGSAERAGCVS